MPAVTCPDCNSRYQLPADYAGARVRCKRCGAVIRVPGRAGRSRPRPRQRHTYEEYDDQESDRYGRRRPKHKWLFLKIVLALIAVNLVGTAVVVFLALNGMLPRSTQQPNRQADNDPFRRNERLFAGIEAAQDSLHQSARERLDRMERDNLERARMEREQQDRWRQNERRRQVPDIPTMPDFRNRPGFRGTPGSSITPGFDSTPGSAGRNRPGERPVKDATKTVEESWGTRLGATELVTFAANENALGFEVAAMQELFVIGGKTVRIWQEDRWRTVTGESPDVPMNVVDISADGSVAAIDAGGGIAMLSTTVRRIRFIQKARAGRNTVGMRLSRDGLRVALLDASGTVDLVKRPRTLEASAKALPSITNLQDMAISNNGRWMFVVDGSSFKRVTDKGTNSVKLPQSIDAACISPAGNCVLIHTTDSWQLYDLNGRPRGAAVRFPAAGYFPSRNSLGRKISIRSDGLAACVTTQGFKCVVLSLASGGIDVKGSVPIEPGFVPVHGQFGPSGKLYVLTRELDGDRYRVVAFRAD